MGSKETNIESREQVVGRFVFSEEDLTAKTTTEEKLDPGRKVVLGEDGECRIDVEVGEGEAKVLISDPDGFVCHRWIPGREFSRSLEVPLNHGASMDPENKSLSLEREEGGKRIRRTIRWEEQKGG